VGATDCIWIWHRAAGVLSVGSAVWKEDRSVLDATLAPRQSLLLAERKETRVKKNRDESQHVMWVTRWREERSLNEKTFTCATLRDRPLWSFAVSNTTVEREPIMGVWGLGPQRGSRGQSPGGARVRMAKLPAADEVFVFKTVIFNASATVLHLMMYCLSCLFCKLSK